VFAAASFELYLDLGPRRARAHFDRRLEDSLMRDALRKPRRRRGAALIEAVFCTAVLFYLVMGGVEFGWYMYAKHVVQSAARDGARAAIISGATHSSATSAVAYTMTNAAMQSSGYTCGFKNASTNATITDVSTVARGTGIKVTVSVNFSAFHVRPLGIIPANKAIVGITTLVKE
jgi:Flp pilus assembly protein TadG